MGNPGGKLEQVEDDPPPAGRRCSGCASWNRSSARFCDQCGGELSPAKIGPRLTHDDIRALLKAARAMASPRDLAPVPREVATICRTMAGADACTFTRVLPAGNEMTVLTWDAAPTWTEAGPAHGRRVSLDNRPAIREALAGTVVQKQTGQRQPDDAAAEELAARGIGSLLLIPIMHQEETTGIIELVSRSGDAFPPDRVAPCLELARLVGFAIAQSATLQRELKLVDRLGAVAASSVEAARLLDTGSLLERIPKLIVSTFGHYLVNVFLLDAEAGELVLHVSEGFPVGKPFPHGERVALSDGIVGYVGATGKTHLAPDVSLDPHYKEGPALSETRSELAAPLLAHGDVIGVLDVQSRRRNAFDASDAVALDAMAASLSVAIDNARLFQETRETERRLRAIMDAVPSPLGVYDAAWNVRYVNEAMMHLYGGDRVNAGTLGQSFTTLAEDLAPKLANPEVLLGRDEGGMLSNQGDEVILRDPPRTFIRTVTPVRNDAETIAHISLYKDVTTERAALTAKDRLLSIAAHELRTPLTALMGFIDLLQIQLGKDDASPELVRQRLTTVQREARRLGRLVDELLGLARLESGAAPLVLVSMELGELVRQVIERFSFDGTAARISVEMPDGPIHGVWDEGRLDQILTNIIGNALQYAPAPSTIRIVVRSTGTMARVEVHDQGPGISDAELQQLFEPFVRVGEAARVGGGLGLGLHVSRMLAERHEGRLWLESTVGQGTTAILEIPLQPSDAKVEGQT